MRKTIASLIVGKAFTLLVVSVCYRAFRRPYDEWNVTGNRVVSCEDREYVQGIEYDITIQENSSFPYYLNNINFMCSSSILGERIHRLQTEAQQRKLVAAVMRTYAKCDVNCIIGSSWIFSTAPVLRNRHSIG